MKHSILIVDDEVGICTSLAFALEDRYLVESTTSPQRALQLLREKRFNLCLLDLKIGKYSGLEVLEEMLRMDKDLMVIMMTAYGTIESSVEAIRKGAYTYLTKPLNTAELYLQVDQALEYQRLGAQVRYLSGQLESQFSHHGIIGKSRAMQHVFTLIDKLKDVDTSVVITGESGTGKELVARALHYSSSRASANFQGINCAAIPEGLLEGELFGYSKGAFTGAATGHMGKLEHANNGTIFFDEIGDMPLSLQAKILRILQEKEFTPLGSNRPRKLNLRVVSATNKDLKGMVERGEFRQDLYFRLNVVEIHLPPLRARKQDLPLLFQFFLHRYNEALGKNIVGIAEEARQKLGSYDYPGNVRELSNIVEYAAVMCPGDTIGVEDLPREVLEYKGEPASGEPLFAEDLVGLSLKEVERRVISANLALNNGHRAATANVLGISEKGLRNKITEYGIVIK